MKRQAILICLAAGLIAGAVFGADEQKAGQNKPAGPVARIDSFSARLEKSIADYPLKQSLHEADLATEARARLEAARAYVQKKPKAKESLAMIAACSVIVEAAAMQLQALQKEADAARLLAKLNEARGKLNQTHAGILEIQRSHASELKSALDEEKRRAQKLRDEAERKFNELQSELISVKQDARGTIISMSDILFDIGKASLTGNLKTNLAKIAGILTVFRSSKVIVEGHTDNQGTAEYNQRLSEQRALNVMKFLAEQGVSPNRMTSIGYGFTKPVADNATREGRQKNRRVDLIIQDSKHQKKAKAKKESGDW